MAIENRTLSAGTKLQAKYKGTLHTAEVVQTEDGLRYRLADGREFGSPSSAGKGVTGKSCNGWAFWSLATGDASEPTGTEAAPTTAEEDSSVHPAPKPQRRGKRATEPVSEADGQSASEAAETSA